MFIFPVSEEEIDRVEIKEKNGAKQIVLKTYGLPLIFWGYLAAILTVIGAMYLAVSDPLTRLAATGDQINIALSYTVRVTIILVPFILTCFFFYEKFIYKQGKEIILEHRLFYGLFKIKFKKILKDTHELYVEHFMDTPNVAKMTGDPNLRGFQNKGYFQLWAILEDDKKIVIDKGQRKIDLQKVSEVLKKY